MIMFYFSGTGNSKYIAELFSQQMNASCHSIEEAIDFKQLINSKETIGFCYPIYGSRVPKIMREFVIENMEYLESKKIIIFCTQWLFSGDGARAFTDIFPPDFIQVIYAEHFLMPNNINNVPLLPAANERKLRKYRLRSKRKMRIVCENIKNKKIKKRGFNPASKILGLIQGSTMPAIEQKASDKLWIDKDCNNCQKCVHICPMKNFESQDEQIQTKNNCILCYRCINQCPQKAITIVSKKKIKKQYKGI